MKEATGELSSTVITVVAIALILSLFSVILYPSLKAAIMARLYCQSSVNCTECSGGMQTCHYYDNNMEESTSTIKCDCGDDNSDETTPAS